MIKIINFLKLGIFIAIGLLFNIQNIQSTHIVGGDLTYRHVSGDVYEVTLSLRRDCFLGHPDAEFDPIAHIGIFSANGSQLINFGNNGHLQIPYLSLIHIFDVDNNEFNRLLNSNKGGPEVHVRYIITNVKPVNEHKACPIY